MTDKRILTTPIKAEDLQDINVGDIIYLNGYLVTCRDVAHRRLIEEKRPLPVDIDGGAILHAGPIIRSLGDDKYEMISSARRPVCGWKNSRKNLSNKPASN